MHMIHQSTLKSVLVDICTILFSAAENNRDGVTPVPAVLLANTVEVQVEMDNSDVDRQYWCAANSVELTVAWHGMQCPRRPMHAMPCT